MRVVRSYKYRLYPTPIQEQTLVQWAGCCRWVWNWGLAMRRRHYKETRKALTYLDLSPRLTQLKQQPETAWLQNCPADMVREPLHDLDRAYKNFFEHRARFPRFKSRKKNRQSMRFTADLIVVDAETVRVPKMGLMRAVIHRPLEGIAKSATIKRNPSGEWFVSFVCHIEFPDIPPTTDNPVGIDLGLETFTTQHNGTKIKPPKFYRRGERKIRLLSRRHSRAKKGSNNHQKAKRRLAKAYRNIRNRRMDWLHKHSLKLIQQFDMVCIEDLNVRGLARTKLAKSFRDAAFSTFARMLEYKARWYGRQVVRVDRFFPSTKLCHRCHAQQRLTLSDRIWTCAGCGTTHDRDINAAINILREGLRIVADGTQRR